MAVEVNACTPPYCTTIGSAINNMAKATINAWQAGQLVMVYNPIQQEDCHCVFLGTGPGPVPGPAPAPAPVPEPAPAPAPVPVPGQCTVVVPCQVPVPLPGGQCSVVVPCPGLNSNPAGLEFSHGKSGDSVQKYAVQIIYDNHSLTVPADHVFLTDKGIKQASKMTPVDKLISENGSEVGITSIHLGEYKGGFKHIATKHEAPSPENLKSHLINTNGIMSGDHAIQLHFDKLSNASKAEPSIGSPAYIKKWGDGVLKAPTLSSGGNDKFISAEHLKVHVPEHAHSYIHPKVAQAKSEDAFSEWASPEASGWTNYVMDFFHRAFPDITYELDWTDPTVNAYAWQDPNGARHVAVKGGLVQHAAVKMEGVSLVIAHETGHHYGGQPTFPTGLSCEGQADWSGSRDIMRKIWFGEEYINTTRQAITQMAGFFGVPDSPTIPQEPSAGCDHPEGSCRIATYHAALDLMFDKPACAGTLVNAPLVHAEL